MLPPQIALQMHHSDATMKTSTLPAIRVRPELRQAAEAVLKPGESLSALIEEGLTQCIATRLPRQTFLERGLSTSAKAKASGNYLPADDVLQQLEQRLQHAEAASKDT